MDEGHRTLDARSHLVALLTGQLIEAHGLAGHRIGAGGSRPDFEAPPHRASLPLYAGGRQQGSSGQLSLFGSIMENSPPRQDVVDGFRRLCWLAITTMFKKN